MTVYLEKGPVFCIVVLGKRMLVDRDIQLEWRGVMDSITVS